jgi:hypothetical protein
VCQSIHILKDNSELSSCAGHLPRQATGFLLLSLMINIIEACFKTGAKRTKKPPVLSKTHPNPSFIIFPSHLGFAWFSPSLGLDSTTWETYGGCIASAEAVEQGSESVALFFGLNDGRCTLVQRQETCFSCSALNGEKAILLVNSSLRRGVESRLLNIGCELVDPGWIAACVTAGRLVPIDAFVFSAPRHSGVLCSRSR